MPKHLLFYIGRMAVTGIVLAAAVFAGQQLWVRYQRDPWTRDGRVYADVVEIAPDVAGLVTSVGVDHNQQVKRGDVLFVIDRSRYDLALRQAEAAVTARRSELAEVRRELARNRALRDLVAQEVLQQSEDREDTAASALQAAIAARDLAALNLQRTEVHAPADGFITDLTVKTGDYLSVGKPALAMLELSSFRVEGYFEETKISRLRIGEPVQVRIMGEPEVLRGHIQSIAPGVEDRERQPDSNLLPNVNPTFDWVRLPQRVPVRIMLDKIPPDLKLIAGRTATVSVLDAAGRPGWAW
jgi:multidrug resistance efflux pump